MLSSTDTPDQLAEVGLPDSLYALRRRRMLDVVNALHLTGVQVDIDLPVIAVVGSQSAGKSSLIESISGITLPRASGTCTRCPTECRLSYSDQPWKCIVSLHILTDKDGKPLGHPRNEQFGDVIHDKDEVEDRIRRAQRAILNPSIDYRRFLEDDDPDLSGRELTFSTNSVSLQISGEDVQDLSFCDLPGLIASVGTGGNEGDIELVKNLVSLYISRPSCIILLTVACETDFQNQGAHQLAKKYDPHGLRTIGVLTKPDRIPSGEEGSWLRYIRNEDEPLEHGWFSVKQPDSRAIATGITWAEAREKEREFFATSSPWNILDLEYQNRLGTTKLVERLSDVLSDCISQRLPIIQEELHKLLSATDERLTQLPKPPSSDVLSEVLFLLSTFSKSLGRYLEGTTKADGLLQSIRPPCDTFRKAIRATEPDFRPYEHTLPRQNPHAHKFVAAAFLENEGYTYIPENDSRAIFIDDVMKRAHEARTRELPGHIPFVVTQEYITAIIAGWQGPAETLFREEYNILVKHVRQLVNEHFAQYPLLQSRIMTITTDFLATSAEQTIARIRWFIALETRPRTLNEAYYSDYHDRFLSHYKGWRPPTESVDDDDEDDDDEDDPHASFTSRLRDNGPSFRAAVGEVMAGLAKMDIHGTRPGDLAKLLPPDPYDPAIEIMASVRAYFQVAHKRFVDNIPNTIDYELILGLDRDQALDKALRKGLGIGGGDALAQCAEYIKEPRHVAERREELLKKRERLETARKQLTEVWL
ncbi:P-loop containing nucleoside triphosphate hydrolase protein [Dichomitus squalens]|uniref:P-loop containing nucleoside triphosphate hydrolase protein n=1 Tax=Dichomitus squalens TaxID=114155 RepID=A0A4Q9PG90_9APHY|nr:P-loop containing nucleoside triphosphate hydrolase protein [Dichomitus squalens]